MEFYGNASGEAKGLTNVVTRDNDVNVLESGEGFFPELGLLDGKLVPMTGKVFSSDGRMVNVLNPDGSAARNEDGTIKQQQAFTEYVRVFVFTKDDAGKWHLLTAVDPQDGKTKPLIKRVFSTSLNRVLRVYKAEVLKQSDLGLELSAETADKFNLNPNSLVLTQAIPDSGEAATLFKSYAHNPAGANAAFVGIAQRLLGLASEEELANNVFEVYKKFQEHPDTATIPNVVVYTRLTDKAYLTRNWNATPTNGQNKLRVDYAHTWTIEAAE